MSTVYGKVNIENQIICVKRLEWKERDLFTYEFIIIDMGQEDVLVKKLKHENFGSNNATDIDIISRQSRNCDVIRKLTVTGLQMDGYVLQDKMNWVKCSHEYMGA